MSETPPEETPLESPSILTSTKASLGVPESHTAFDAMITLHINSVLSTLEQLGVGPEGGLYVTSKTQTWTELIGTDNRLNAVKSYMYLRVRMLFDPPDIGFVLTAMKEQIKELEWRLNVAVDSELTETTSADDDEVIWIVASDEPLPEGMESGDLGLDPETGDVWRLV